MATDGAEIDLYAEDLEHEFNQDNDFTDQNVDLYDDVIAPTGNKNHGDNDDYGLSQDGSNSDSNTNDVHQQNNNVHHENNNHSSGKKISIYVGNLTWWTSDIDVIEAVNGLGVNDIYEVKFFENRANGQSKGFCVVNLGSDSSVRNVIDNLPKQELHGQNPVVTPCNRQSLNHFEMQSRKMTPGGPGSRDMGGPPPGGPRPPYGGHPGGGMRPPLIQRPSRPNGPLLPGQPRMPMHPPGSPYGQNQHSWQGPPRPMHHGPRPGMPLMRMPPHNRGPAPGQGPLLRNPGPPMDHNRPPQHPPPMQEWNDHPSHGHGPPNMNMQGGQQNQMPPRPHGGPPGMPQGGPHQGPAPHVNPAFFQAPHQGPPPPNDQYNRMGGGPGQYGGHGDYGRHGGGDGPTTPQISEIEFEEIMNKNRSISSGAISRAVSDASSGDTSIAIDTLMTAIALIRQSKVSHDERCQILISSLQDTLQGIETKSHYRKERPRSSRSRERERSREHSSRRDKPRRDRSRSRDRYHREPSHERYRDDRYHEDRSYRDKDRDRDRERDHRRH